MVHVPLVINIPETTIPYPTLTEMSYKQLQVQCLILRAVLV